nr:MAG TPA: hypothetical protein [Caudoviricetes sp.]
MCLCDVNRHKTPGQGLFLCVFIAFWPAIASRC